MPETPIGRRSFVTGAAAAALVTGGAGPARAAEPVGGNLPVLHPGLARRLDIPDVASIAAPRPMYFLDGADDTLFTAEGVEAAYERMRTVWRSRKAGDRLRTETWPGLGHVFTEPMQNAVLDWLDATL